MEVKETKREYLRNYYQEHREELLEQTRQYDLNHKEEKKARNKKDRTQLRYTVLSHYSQGEPRCLSCGIIDLDVLTIDHIKGNGNAHRKITGGGVEFYRWLRKNNFPDGYQTLCFNCNAKKYRLGFN